MKITFAGGYVEIFVPAIDAQGKPLKDAQGTEIGAARSLTLEQYEKHARDPQFAAAASLTDRAAIAAAIDATRAKA